MVRNGDWLVEVGMQKKAICHIDNEILILLWNQSLAAFSKILKVAWSNSM